MSTQRMERGSNSRSEHLADLMAARAHVSEHYGSNWGAAMFGLAIRTCWYERENASLSSCDGALQGAFYSHNRTLGRAA